MEWIDIFKIDNVYKYNINSIKVIYLNLLSTYKKIDNEDERLRMVSKIKRAFRQASLFYEKKERESRLKLDDPLYVSVRDDIKELKDFFVQERLELENRFREKQKEYEQKRAHYSDYGTYNLSKLNTELCNFMRRIMQRKDNLFDDIKAGVRFHDAISEYASALQYGYSFFGSNESTFRDAISYKFSISGDHDLRTLTLEQQVLFLEFVAIYYNHHGKFNILINNAYNNYEDIVEWICDNKKSTRIYKQIFNGEIEIEGLVHFRHYMAMPEFFYLGTEVFYNWLWVNEIFIEEKKAPTYTDYFNYITRNYSDDNIYKTKFFSLEILGALTNQDISVIGESDYSSLDDYFERSDFVQLINAVRYLGLDFSFILSKKFLCLEEEILDYKKLVEMKEVFSKLKITKINELSIIELEIFKWFWDNNKNNIWIDIMNKCSGLFKDNTKETILRVINFIDKIGGFDDFDGDKLQKITSKDVLRLNNRITNKEESKSFDIYEVCLEVYDLTKDLRWIFDENTYKYLSVFRKVIKLNNNFDPSMSILFGSSLFNAGAIAMMPKDFFNKNFYSIMKNDTDYYIGPLLSLRLNRELALYLKDNKDSMVTEEKTVFKEEKKTFPPIIDVKEVYTCDDIKSAISDYTVSFNAENTLVFGNDLMNLFNHYNSILYEYINDSSKTENYDVIEKLINELSNIKSKVIINEYIPNLDSIAMKFNGMIKYLNSEIDFITSNYLPKLEVIISIVDTYLKNNPNDIIVNNKITTLRMHYMIVTTMMLGNLKNKSSELIRKLETSNLLISSVIPLREISSTFSVYEKKKDKKIIDFLSNIYDNLYASIFGNNLNSATINEISYNNDMPCEILTVCMNSLSTINNLLTNVKKQEIPSSEFVLLEEGRVKKK